MFNNKSYKKTYMPNYLLRISVGLFFTLIPLFTTFAQITQVGAVTNASGANVQTLTVNKPTGAVIGDVLIEGLLSSSPLHAAKPIAHNTITISNSKNLNFFIILLLFK